MDNYMDIIPGLLQGSQYRTTAFYISAICKPSKRYSHVGPRASGSCPPRVALRSTTPLKRPTVYVDASFTGVA